MRARCLRSSPRRDSSSTRPLKCEGFSTTGYGNVASGTSSSWLQVPRRVIAEPLLRDAHGDVPPDIKAYVIGGRVRYFQVDGGRFTRPTRNLYGPDWSLLPARTSLPRHPMEPAPAMLPSLVEFAERLAAPFEFLRVDFYVIGEQVLVGELTSSPGAGFGRYYPASFGETLASHWALDRRVARSAPVTPTPALPALTAHKDMLP